MELIDKDKVVENINSVLDSFDPNEITSGRYELVKLRNFLDTLEVFDTLEIKEENLEKEKDDYWKNHVILNFKNFLKEMQNGLMI